MAGDDGIPRNAENILFAEDLVHYVMLLYVDVEILPHRVEKHRGFIYNGFDETIREAIQSLDMPTSIQKIFILMRDNGDVHINMYKNYTKEFRSKFLSKVFDGYTFLNYCTNIATLAAFFYSCKVPEAPDLAISSIISTMEAYDMTNGGWEALNRTAEKLVFGGSRTPQIAVAT